MESLILPIATLSPFYIPISMIIAYIISFDFVFIFFFALSLLNMGLNIGLKNIFGKLLPNNPLIRRPYLPDSCCSIFPKCNMAGQQGPQPGIQGIIGSFGMPSGHSQLAMLFLVFFSLYIYGHSSSYLKFIPILFLSLFSGFVLWSRIYVRCHTSLQIFVGGLIGIIFGAIGYLFYSYLASWLNLPAESVNAATYFYLILISFSLLLLFSFISSAFTR